MSDSLATAYTLAADATLSAFESSAGSGLSPEEAARRLEQDGPNAIPPQKGESKLQLLMHQFTEPLILILLGAVALTMFLREWIDAIVILIVVLINAAIGYAQEVRALAAIAALSKELHLVARVVRGGETLEIPASDLVLGDIVLLLSGDKVPADLRLVQVRELQVDESALTGESLPLEKQLDPPAEDTGLGDRTNLVFSSSLVTYGAGRGVVVATGTATQIGKINAMIASASVLVTPLTLTLRQFSGLILKIVLALSLIVIAAMTLRGTEVVDAVLAAVALVVGAVPEGLPAVVTATLALGVSRMARRNAIVRKLPAVETLGSTTVICSDKTGTLTQNQMTVRAIWAGGETYGVSGSGYAASGTIQLHGQDAELSPTGKEVVLAGVLSNDSRVFEEDGQWLVEGDPTEAALYVSARKAGLDDLALRKSHPRLDAIPFESQNQYMASLQLVGDKPVVYLKGSVERALEACTTDSKGNPLDVAAITAAVEQMTGAGQRVLAFWKAEMPTGTTEVEPEHLVGRMVFLGLQAMIDPPRPEAIAAIAACQTAGIQVKMITGDHLGTATAIADQLGLRRGPTADHGAINGKELEALSDEQLNDVAPNTAVFARVSPEQKLRLVSALQRKGHVVAMTGDGVNDAPALRQANIGVAMGITGTEVTKEAADMILTDDNFASIEAAVQEGRRVYDNLIKFILWTIPTSFAEAGVILIASLLGMDLPITPLQVLWINLTTSVLLGTGLAFENGEPGTMKRPPRAVGAPILSRQLIVRTVIVGVILLSAVFFVFNYKVGEGMPIESARTAAINVVVVGETFYLFSCRSLAEPLFSRKMGINKFVFLGAAIMTALQVAFTYWAPLQAPFQAGPTSWPSWALAGGAGLLVVLYAEWDKWRVARR